MPKTQKKMHIIYTVVLLRYIAFNIVFVCSTKYFTSLRHGTKCLISLTFGSEKLTKYHMCTPIPVFVILFKCKPFKKNANFMKSNNKHTCVPGNC